MKVGDKVAFWTHGYFIKYLYINEINIFDYDYQKLYFKTNDGSRFFMESDYNSGKHYNVGNHAFWIWEL